MYPDPVDPTPSYDDTVSFIWVMVGVATGTRYFVDHPFAAVASAPANVRYSFGEVGLVVSVARGALGVGIVVGWRLVAKKVLFVLLPPVYRVLQLRARKFFLSANCVFATPPPTHKQKKSA